MIVSEYHTDCKALIISNREVQVLELIAFEYTTKEVAELLHISAHTAESHRKNLMIKMGARNTAGLVRRGYELKILEIGSSDISKIKN